METQLLRKFLHDLNNALNAGKINAFLLRQESLDVKQAEALTGINAAFDSARDIIIKMYNHINEDPQKD